MPDVQSQGRFLRLQTAVRDVHPATASNNNCALPLDSKGCPAFPSPSSSSQSVLVVIDANVPDAENLIQSAIAGVNILRLDAERDGILQITEALQQRRHITALHIISHGSPGCLYLGNSRLSQETLPLYATQLRQWNDALTDNASILLYGCNVAAEPQQWGLSSQPTPFLRALHQLTGRAIAASSTPIGNANLGGNWNLDVVVRGWGDRPLPSALYPLPSLPFTPETLATYRGLLAIFTVTNTNDSGAGSLRQAILNANAAGGADEIRFNIAGAGPHTINVLSSLPPVVGFITLDATTQPGFAVGSPQIVLNGAGAGAGANGLTINAQNTIRGLVIQGFSGAGIYIIGDNNKIEGNYIGTNATGTAAVANGTGILFEGNSSNTNTIGGTTAATRNVISGNTNSGVVIQGPSGSGGGNQVLGNYIGTNAAGTGAIANGGSGIEIRGGVGSNTIGGSVAGAGNLISGNTQHGISIDAPVVSPSFFNTIQGNIIGLSATGLFSISNGQDGIRISGRTELTTIGGSTAAARNIISGNNGNGIFISGAVSNPNTIFGTDITGNYIGTNINGSGAIGNSGDGIRLDGIANNTIGGTTTGERNLISGNLGDGIEITGSASTGNVVQGNYIGLDVTGTLDGGNLGDGIRIANGASNNTIGSTDAGGRNIISGNNNNGIQLEGSGTTGNTVIGNYIGTNAAGTGAIANSTDGIAIRANADGNTIGGTTAGAGNVVSGNGLQGIAIFLGADNTVVQGNLVGTNASGTAALGNGGDGVRVDGGVNTTIGGTTAAARNVISGNNGNGVSLVESNNGNGSSNSNVVQGNYIGTGINGTTAIANSGNGVFINDVSVNGSTAQNNLIGGTAAGAGNLIANNGQDGVAIAGSEATGNAVQGNSILNNGQLGIDLGNNGVTANDAGDGDTGANGLQNFPVLATAIVSGGTTTITGTLNTLANADIRIEFFSNDAADGSGNGEGQTFLTAITTSTDGSGNYTINEAIAQDLTGKFITATVTRVTTGDTSEFSGAIEVLADPLVVTNTNDSGVGSLRNAINFANSNPGADTITFNIPTSDPNYNAGPPARWTIRPTTNLPDITGQTTIDATTQPGYAGTPLIELNGSSNGSIVDIAFNLRPGSDGSTFKGLVINNFDFAAFFVESNGNTFQGNYIGTDITGTVDQGNGGGFNINGSNNVIGGTGANEGNLISGNGYGISLNNGNNTIQGNLIGTDVTGVVALGNLGEGISLGLSTGNQIGGTTAAARNVISGNGDYGISLITLSNNNVIQGNYIGVGSNGTTALGNTNGGIYLQESSGNQIGGTAAGAGNVISSNTGAGIELWGPASTSDNNIIQGNFIGTNAAGTADLGNTAEGIWLRDGANDNTIGGTTAAARNIISGNNTNGITINGTGNAIAGNYIGTNAAGTADLGNTLDGVFISNAASNTIGGATAGAGNLLSGNNRNGVLIQGASATSNIVQGNFIGTDNTGNTVLTNSDAIATSNGINIQAPNNTIGGTVAGAGNVIGGARNTGIAFETAAATNNTIQGNSIGVGANGTSNIGNTTDGIAIFTDGGGQIIGGTVAGAGNIIANNGNDGVAVTSSSNNQINGNSIFNNGQLGIDLGNNGVTANDAGDGDTGANALQNFPVITAATASGANTLITGTFNSTANTNFRLEFFSNPTADPSGNGEGQTFLGFVNVTTNASGNATFNPTFAAVPAGQFITATATNLTTNNTSEFASARVVTGTPTVTLGLTGSPLAENGGVATVTATLSNVSAQDVTVNLGFTGTATNVSDYTRSGTSILIPAGSLTGSITLTGVNDLLDEANETIIVDVTSVTNGTESGTQQVTATITDDDPAPTVSISPATIVQNEGNSGTTAYIYTVSLSAASGLPVTVNYTTNNGTATAGSDYIDNDGSLVFNPGGPLAQNITVLVNGDTTPEPTENFTVALNSATNGTLGTSSATGTITNDDVALPTVSISPTTLTLAEGNSGTRAFTFTVTLSAASAVPVTVNYTTNNGTATVADNDYIDNDGALVFNPGDPLSKTITVLVNGDNRVEANETFAVTLNSAVNAALGTNTATGIINNDEARISLTNAVSGGNGVIFNGIASGDFAGGAVSNAGDINNDGFDDLIISARRADPNGRTDAGAVYVVFGRASGFPSLSSLNGTNGFRIIGSKASDNLGGAVSSAGDINNDGYADIVIGARSADPASRRTDAGQAYVILGGPTSSFANFPTIDVSTLRKPGGFQDGFTISGERQYDSLGSSVSDVGDVDGDSYDDFLVGAVTGDPSGRVDAGQAYLIFGGPTSRLTDLDLTTLSNSSGLRINGVTAGDNLGYAVGAAGDVNRDGRADFIVSATKADPGGSNRGQSYVVFGSASLRTSGIPDLATLNGTNGFRINGVANEDNSGLAVKQAGDINGDSFTDLVITAPNADPNGSNSGAIYVVFGSATLGAGGTVNLSSLNGTNGFRLTGVAAGDFAGVSVEAAGDLNGDSFSDLVIGAYNADPGGSNSGETYVMYGGSTVGAGGTFNLSSINGSNGLVLTGVTANSFSGFAVAAGNFNGAGSRDLLIGAPGVGAGSAYLVFGAFS
jgi:trimeric autotransporter adhesin